MYFKITRTLSYLEKGPLNSIACRMRLSKDRLEQVQKHMIKRYLRLSLTVEDETSQITPLLYFI